MHVLFGLAIVVTLVLIASSKQLYALRRSRFGAAFTTGGWAMVALGFLLGPHVTSLVSVEQFSVLYPIVYFLLGWAGLVIGLQFNKKIFHIIPPPVFKLALLDCILAIIVIGGGLTLFLFFYTQTLYPAIIIALIFTAVTIGWSPEVRSLHIGRPDQQPIALAIRAIAGLGTIFAVIVYALATIIFKPLPPSGVVYNPPLTILLNLLLAIIVGGVMGIVGKWLIDIADRKNQGEFLVILIGVVTFAAGAAATMGIASILVAMVTGMVLANLPDKILLHFKQVLLDAEQPIGMGIMLAAGLFADPAITTTGLILIPIVIALRFIIKRIIIAFQFRKLVAKPFSLNIIHGLLRQNPLAIVIVVGYAISPLGQAYNPILTGSQLLSCIILIGLICELFPLLAPPHTPQNDTTLTDAPIPETTPDSESSDDTSSDSTSTHGGNP